MSERRHDAPLVDPRGRIVADVRPAVRAHALGAQWDELEAPYVDGFLDGAGETATDRQRSALESTARDAEATLARERSRVAAADEAERAIRAATLQTTGDERALQEAVRAFEEGDDPAAIADELARAHPGALQPYLHAWYADELGISPAELAQTLAARPSDPASWLQQHSAQTERLNALGRAQNEAAAREEAASREAETRRQMTGEVERALREIPGADRLAPLAADFVARSGFDPQTPEEMRMSIELGLNSAREVHRAQRVAEIRADFDLHNDQLNNHWLDDKERDRPALDRETAIESNLAAYVRHDVDPRRIVPRLTPQERAAAAQAMLDPDATTRSLDDGFSSIDRLDTGERLAQEEMRRRGLR